MRRTCKLIQFLPSYNIIALLMLKFIEVYHRPVKEPEGAFAGDSGSFV